MPEPEDALLDALARLHVAGEDVHRPRAPAWSACSAPTACSPRCGTSPVGTGAEALEEPAAAFKAALDEALADTSALTADERAARSGLANRQVTIR